MSLINDSPGAVLLHDRHGARDFARRARTGVASPQREGRRDGKTPAVFCPDSAGRRRQQAQLDKGTLPMFLTRAGKDREGEKGAGEARAPQSGPADNKR